MAQPATGVEFKAGISFTDALRVRRGGDWTIAVRDNNGALTNISPGGTFGSPMADDGLFRGDLWAIKKVNGKWVYNMETNLGFYPIGLLHPDGIERTPKIDSDPLEALQSLDPVRVDMQKREKTLMFTPLENSPVVHRLRHNLPLTDVLDLGDGTYFSGELDETNQIRRQIIVLHEDRQGGKVERNAFPLPRCVLTDAGAMKGNKKDADAPKLTFTREIDPWFVGVDSKPLIDGCWVSGSLWDDGLTPGLTFLPTTPAATETGATSASIVFPKPLGGSGSNVYTVEKSPNGTGTWTAATVGSTSGTSTITLGITGLTTGTTYYFRVTATDSASTAAVSRVSNSITTD